MTADSFHYFDVWTKAIGDEILTKESGQYLPLGHGCKGRCMQAYKDRMSYGRPGNQFLVEGWRKCRVCEMLFLTTDKFCKCCGKQTSTRSKRAGKK